MKLSCVIVEDEVKAKDVLKRYIDRVDYLEYAAYCKDGLEAFNTLPKLKPDIIFLDINMPNLNGLELLELLKYSPNVIITSAYSEYAINSYEFDVVDYLLKPIAFSKFIRAVSRVARQTLNEEEVHPTRNETPGKMDYALLKSGSKTHKVSLNDIVYLEKDGNYIDFHLADGRKILIRSNMSDVFDLVPPLLFQRVHKSFVVNLNKITTIEVNQLTLPNNKTIPLGASYRQELNSRM
ncbi:MAG: LytTR family DNA-binding domain-containing protein [Bacteroidota bacterium]